MASPSPNSRVSDDETEDQPELPLTMAASVVLTSLPKDAHKALEGAGEPEVEKVTVRFHPVGSAPPLKMKVATVSASKRFDTVVKFLRRKLPVQKHETVFCYVNSVFAPALDEGVDNLWRCFRTGDELVVNYSITASFG